MKLASWSQVSYVSLPGPLKYYLDAGSFNISKKEWQWSWRSRGSRSYQCSLYHSDLKFFFNVLPELKTSRQYSIVIHSRLISSIIQQAFSILKTPQHYVLGEWEISVSRVSRCVTNETKSSRWVARITKKSRTDERSGGERAKAEGLDGGRRREFRERLRQQAQRGSGRDLWGAGGEEVLLLSPSFSLPPTVISFLSCLTLILAFFTLNLVHPNGGITHVMLPPQDACERKGHVWDAGGAFTGTTQRWCQC